MSPCPCVPSPPTPPLPSPVHVLRADNIVVNLTALARPRTGRVSSRAILGGVSAAFPAAGLTAIVGANGVGKTTLLRTLLGLLTPDSGRVLLHERDLAAYSARDRARTLAYVPQRAEGAHGFSVREMVAMGRYAIAGNSSAPAAPPPDHTAEVHAALARLSLLDRAAEPFGTLSAGQQQRALLARALAQLSAGREGASLTGKVLLADEPVAAMDAGHALSTLALLRSLADAGLCIVCVMHDLNLVLRMATHVVALGPPRPASTPSSAAPDIEPDHAGCIVVGHGPPGEIITPEIMGPLFGASFERVEGPRAAALIATGPGSRTIQSP